MKSFRDYVKIREGWDDEDETNEKDNDEMDDSPSIAGKDSEKMNHLYRLVRLAWKNNRNQTMHFFKRLATINPEIASEFEKLAVHDDSELDYDGPVAKDYTKDREVIRPSVADTNTGDNGDSN